MKRLLSSNDAFWSSKFCRLDCIRWLSFYISFLCRNIHDWRQANTQTHLYIKEGKWKKKWIVAVSLMKNVSKFALQNIGLFSISFLMLFCSFIIVFFSSAQFLLWLSMRRSEQKKREQITSIDWMPKHNHRRFVYTLKQKMACKWNALAGWNTYTHTYTHARI